MPLRVHTAPTPHARQELLSAARWTGPGLVRVVQRPLPETSPQVALVITATFPFMVITATFQAKFAQGFDHDSSKRFSAANSTAADAVTNIK